LAAVLVAVLELDVVQFGQFMISRPLVLGPVLGLLFGQPQTGLVLGACCELFSLDDVPVGDKLPLNATVAVAVSFLMICSPSRVPPELALPAGLLAGWAHQKLETLLRQRRRMFCCQAEQSLEQGRSPRLGCIIASALAEQAAWTLGLLLFCVLVGGPLLQWVWPFLPRGLSVGLGVAWELAPWLGLGVLLHALRPVR
jgi:mannose/fructose/N-acetylgalactosamine-specific phosphotransferase system component IIC